MKQFSLVIAVSLLTLLAATSASAQISDRGVIYDLTGSLVLPMEDGVDMGIGIGTDVFFWTPSSDSPLQVGSRFALNFFSGDVDLTVWEFLPTCRYWLPSKTNLSFFLEGSVGIYHGRADGYSETDLGIGIGGGAMFSNGIFVMPKFNISDFDYISLNVGKMF